VKTDRTDRKKSAGTVLLGTLLLLAALSAGAVPAAVPAVDDPDAKTDRVDLTGIVLDEVGEPVPGAWVFVESAHPRKGTSNVCPSCYPDCQKRAVTDGKGEFKLPDVNAGLLFHLLFVAKDYEAKEKDKVDALQSPISFALWKRAALALNQKLINARVYASNGKPAAGAYLEIEGAETGSFTTWGGQKKYIQSIGVTDDRGIMTLVASADLKNGLGILQAPGHAKQWVKVTPGKDQIFLLREGVIVRGQVLKEGQPVSGLRMAFSGADRTAGEFMQGWEVSTDTQGRFSFSNVTPSKQFNLYSLAKGGAKLGVVSPRPFSTGPDQSTLDLGKMEIQAPLHLHGRVISETGDAVFSGTKIMLGREQAWDYQETTIGDEGEFEFDGLGTEQVELSLRATGYKFSKKNPNRITSHSIGGQLRESLDDFVVVLEETDKPDDPNNRDDDNWPARETPLRGAKK
jgi:hypothetical protein